MRRLGVHESDMDDAMQELVMVMAERQADIEPGRERSFLFGTAFRVASEHRRRRVRRREVDEEQAPERVASTDIETSSDGARARRLLEHFLEDMPIELRAPFVLHEIEERTLPEIADLLGLPLGTATSRLRRAREDFEGRVARYQARQLRGGPRE